MAIVGGSRVALSKGSSASGPRFKPKTVQQAGKKRLSSPSVGSRAAQATAVKRAQPLELLETFLNLDRTDLAARFSIGLESLSRSETITQHGATSRCSISLVIRSP